MEIRNKVDGGTRLPRNEKIYEKLIGDSEIYDNVATTNVHDGEGRGFPHDRCATLSLNTAQFQEGLELTVQPLSMTRNEYHFLSSKW